MMHTFSLLNQEFSVFPLTDMWQFFRQDIILRKATPLVWPRCTVRQHKSRCNLLLPISGSKWAKPKDKLTTSLATSWALWTATLFGVISVRSNIATYIVIQEQQLRKQWCWSNNIHWTKLKNLKINRYEVLKTIIHNYIPSSIQWLH